MFRLYYYSKKENLLDAIWKAVKAFHKAVGSWPTGIAVREDEWVKGDYPKIPVERLSKALQPRHFRLYGDLDDRKSD